MAEAVGILEVFGLATAFVAADAGCKAANVRLEVFDKNKPAAEPLAVIDQFTKCDGQLALFVGSELIQSQSFQHLMSLIEDGYI